MKQRAEEQQRVVASVGVITVLESEYLRHESLIAVGHRFGGARRTAREQYESALIFRRLVNARSIAESQDRSVVPEHTALRKEDHRPRQLAEGIAGQGCVIVGGDQRRAAGGYQLLGHFSSRQAPIQRDGDRAKAHEGEELHDETGAVGEEQRDMIATAHPDVSETGRLRFDALEKLRVGDALLAVDQRRSIGEHRARFAEHPIERVSHDGPPYPQIHDCPSTASTSSS